MLRSLSLSNRAGISAHERAMELLNEAKFYAHIMPQDAWIIY